MAFIPAIGAAILGTTGTAAAVGTAATVTGALAIGATAAGIGSSIYSMTQSSKQGQSDLPKTETPTVPKPEDAVLKAQEELTRRRKARILSGGQTIFAGGINEAVNNVNAGKSLLGQ